MGKLIIGADEVGLGALAGPVVTAAVILPAGIKFQGLRDSKKMTPTDRAWMDSRIREEALGWVIAGSNSELIDQHGIDKCRWVCMGACVAFCLERFPTAMVVVDGNRKIPGIPWNMQTAIIKADDKVLEVSAASVIAKVYRDRLMVRLWEELPYYDWKKNAGYGTRDHLAALRKYGVSVYHRKSYGPVTKQLAKEEKHAESNSH
jgi:ribonuclease HII